MLSGSTLSQYKRFTVHKSRIQPGLWLVIGHTYGGGIHRMYECYSERWADEQRLQLMKRRMTYLNQLNMGRE